MNTTSPELKEKYERIFYGKFIELTDETLFKLYSKFARKIVFINELKCFFELYNEV